MNLYFTFIISLFFLFVPQKGGNKIKPNLSEIIKKRDANYFNLNKKLKRISLEESLKFYELSVSENYLIGEIYALNNLGIYYKKQRDYNKSIEYHNKALNFCKKNNLFSLEMVCLNLIGSAYSRQDDIRNAFAYHQSVINLGKRIKKKTLQNKVSISIAQNSLGNIYGHLKQYDLAIEQYREAIKLQENTKNLRGLAINHQTIGKAYEHLKKYDISLLNYQKSLAFNKELGSDYGKVICINSISSVLIKQGDYKEALALLKENYFIAEKLNNQYYFSQLLASLGFVQLKLKDYNGAFKNLNKALVTIENLKSPKRLKSKILYYLSELFENKNELKKALSYNKKAIEIENKITDKRNNVYVQNLISKKRIESEWHRYNELENENEIKSLQLTRNRNILIITLITIALLTAVLYSIYRQHLLKNDQKILLLEQQALQTQMNPHFVFNALNSIKLYIINNEQKNAVYYLNKFSKLIRNILEVSKVKEVSLQEELSTMSLYMSIENIRFDNNINYKEVICPNLNTNTIKLPPLVLQPFLENAIWHGLSSKETGTKEITLEACKFSEELIEINITDNGIGRKAALEIKKNKSLKRKSVGIELTKERLTTFCYESLTEFSLEYHDLVDKQGKPLGTSVSIKIPLS